MERRDLLKTVGGIGAASAVGGAGLMATTGSAAAATVGEFNISDASITTDGGTITGFTVSPEITMEYDGLDQDANKVHMQFGIVTPEEAGEKPNTSLSTYNGNGSRPAKVSEEESLDTRAGSYTWDMGPFKCLPQNNPNLTTDYEAASEDDNQDLTWTYYDAERFKDETEGDGPALTEVEFYCMGWISPKGGRFMENPGRISDSGTVQVRVTNEKATGDVGASGTTTLEGDNQEV